MLLKEIVVAEHPLNVLFLCTGNSARSIMAEAILNRSGGGRIRAWSAGSIPKGEVHPRTLAILERNGFNPRDFRSKAWEEFSDRNAPKLDFVFTVCDNAANEVCPIWPGQPITAHWGLPDPASASGNDAEIALAFAETCRLLNNRIALFTSLPFDRLDRMSLQRRLDEIGGPPSASPAA